MKNIKPFSEEELLERCLISEHMVLSGGLHTDTKFDFDKIANLKHHNFMTPSPLIRVGFALAELIQVEFPDCDTIITVGGGANCLAAPVAHQFQKSSDKEIDYFKTTKLKYENGDFKKFIVDKGAIYLKRDPELPKRECVIVDDVFTEGTNAGRVADVVKFWHARVIGIATVLNRNMDGINELYRPADDASIPVRSLINKPIEAWPAEECLSPSCK